LGSNGLLNQNRWWRSLRDLTTGCYGDGQGFGLGFHGLGQEGIEFVEIAFSRLWTEGELGFNLLSARGFSSATCSMRHPSGGETKRAQSKKVGSAVMRPPSRWAGRAPCSKGVEEKSEGGISFRFR
jgi:hypothetical protein